METVWLFCLLPPSLLKYLMMCLLAVAGWSLQPRVAAIEVSRLQQRQAESAATPISSPASSTRPVSPNSSFGGVLSDYWFVCLVLVVVTVVGCVFLCGCMVRKKRRQGRLHISQTQLQRMDSADAPHGGVNSGLELVSAGSPGTSFGRSPISSPQPSFSSSHKSFRSSGHGSGRKKRRNHSPGHTSSGSEDTVRPNQSYSVSSLASSVSTLGPHSGRLHRAESFSSGRGSDRGAGGPYQRSRSNSQVTAMTAAESPLHSAPSSLSIESRSSSRPSSRLALSRPSSRLTTASGVVKVDVKVHLGQEQPAHFQIAAALAESARQLAQSAANFEQEDTWASSTHHSPRSNLSSPRGSMTAGLHHPSSFSSLRGYHPSRRQLFSNHSAAAQSREHSAMFRDPIASLDRPANLVSLDRPANLVGLDRPVNTASLDRPGRTEHARRSSATSFKSLNSDPNHYQRHAASLEYGYRVPTHPNILEEDGLLYSHMVRRGEDHTPNGFHHHPKPLKQLPATERSEFIHYGPTGNKGTCDYGGEDYSRRGEDQDGSCQGDDQGSKSESGCDSNASTLKALPVPFKSHREAAGGTNSAGDIGSARGTNSAGGRQTSDKVRTNEEEASQHGRQLSLLSEQGSIQDSVEAPSSSQPSSQPSLSRTGSALSLDPQLSSTASGYAATGSTSSLDTISKTDATTQQQPPTLNNVVFPEHSHAPAAVLAPVGRNHIHVARLAEAGLGDGNKPFSHIHTVAMFAEAGLRAGYTTMAGTSPGHAPIAAATPIPRGGGDTSADMMYHHTMFSSEDSGATSSPDNFTIDV